MTALSAGINTPWKEGKFVRHGVKANTTLYKGGFAVLNSSGYLEMAAAGMSNGKLAGVVVEPNTAQGATDGAVYAVVQRDGIFEFTFTSVAVTHVGKPAYVVYDNEVNATPVGVSVGHIVALSANANKCYVELDTNEAEKGYHVLSIPIVKHTSEFDSTYDLPARSYIVAPPLVELTAGGTTGVTVTCGILASESGDADGFLKAVKTESNAVFTPDITNEASASITLGALLYEAVVKDANTTVLYTAPFKPYFIATAKSVSYSTTDTADIAGFIHIPYMVV